MSEVVATLRARKKVAVRESLLEAALTLFDEQGFTETTLDDIAERAQVSTRTLFRYFPSKAALLRPATADYLDIFCTLIAEASPGESHIETLHRALRATLESFHDDRDLFVRQHRICIQEGIDLGGDEFSSLWVGLESHIASSLGTSPDADPKPTLLTGIGVGIAAGAVHRWLSQDAQGDLGQLVDDGFAELKHLVDGVARN